jgi:hypothetical protein
MDVPQGARLLSIGEIFDRAVNVVLKNFLPLSLAYGITLLPFRIFDDWVQRSTQGRFDSAIGTVIGNPHLLSQFARLSVDPTHKTSLAGWGLIGVGLIVGGLAGALLATVALRILRGERPEPLQAFSRALSVWFRVVVLQIATLLVAALVVFAALVIWVIPALIWPVVRTPGGVVVTLSITFALLFCSLEAWGFCAFGAIVLDGVGVSRAMTSAWKMTMTRAMRLRSLAFGFGIFACDVISLVFTFALVGIAYLVTHQSAVGFALRELSNLAIAVFINVAGIVFYLDAKTRYAAIQDAAQNRENSAAR